MIALRKPAPAPLPDVSRPFLAFVADEATAEIVRSAAEVRNLPADSIIVGGLDDAIDGLANIRTPSMLLVDLGAGVDVMVEAERLAEVCDADARVILIGTVNDMLLHRDLIAAGVGDYIVKPFTAEILVASMERLRPTAPAAKAPGAVAAPIACDAVAVIGVRGGVGASMLAANMAWLASEELQKRVSLVDLDLTFGTQALNMDIDPGNGLGEAMSEPDRMDELFVKRASVSVSTRLRVLAAETDPGRGDIASAPAFNGLYEFLRQENDLVIVDLPRMLAVGQPDVFKEMTRIILVAEPTLAAMRDTARLTTLIRAKAPDTEISVVLNRQGMAPKEELSIKSFEDGSALKIAAALPFDAKLAFAAEAAGKCVIQHGGRSKLARALRAVAMIAAGLSEKPEKPGLSDLLRRFGSSKKDKEASGDVR